MDTERHDVPHSTDLLRKSIVTSSFDADLSIIVSFLLQLRETHDEPFIVQVVHAEYPLKLIVLKKRALAGRSDMKY
jgi:hypothetical protein